ncbi:protein FAM217B isoform X2 [Hyperolius riggenbachi]|uniref:protein FAM217B isoform X2 n=1 Tax=Hyperolius riggenbachi TaxID=752182 RepID=UPI0035A32ED8
MRRSRRQRHGNTQRRSQSVGFNNQGLKECNPLLIPVRKSQTFSNTHKILQPELKRSVNEKSSWDNPRQAVRPSAVCQTKNKLEKKGSLVGRCHAEKILSEELVLRNGVNEYPMASGVSMKHPTSLNLLQISSCPVSDRLSNQKMPSAPHERDTLQVSSCPMSDRLSNQMMPNAPHERDSLEKLFLDLDLAEFRNEEEDSASDLSDSERLPIPPSPLAPPEMNLRAEEISPGYFSLYAKPKSEVYSYPDVLPPPYNSWNLGEISTLLNKEGKNTLKSMPSGCLERYIDRLLHLEWLQSQTVQAEKAKPVKSRSQTAPGLFHHGKYLGKSKSWHSSSPTKQTSNPDNTCKMTCAQERHSHRRYPQRQMSDLPCLSRTSPKSNGSANLSSPLLRNTQVIKAGTKKKSVMNGQQDENVSSCGGSSKMYSTGNLRPPTKQGSDSNHTPSTTKQAKSCKLKKVSNPSSPMSDTDYSLARRNGRNSQPPSCKLKTK